MTYDVQERSNYEGRPINLYQFSVAGANWFYTDAQENVNVPGVGLFETCICSHGTIRRSGDSDADDVTVTLPASTAFATLYRGTPPSAPVRFTLRQRHMHDDETVVVWGGVVKSGRRKDRMSTELTCRTFTADLARPGVRLTWQRGCPHALYDSECKVARAAYAVSVQVSAAGGYGIVAPIGSYPSGYFAGGIVEFTHVLGYTDTRAIESHSGSSLTLLTPADGIAAESFVTLYPGCDRTSLTCDVKFNNLLNYGGIRHLPTKSPFDGDPVF